MCSINAVLDCLPFRLTLKLTPYTHPMPNTFAGSGGREICTSYTRHSGQSSSTDRHATAQHDTQEHDSDNHPHPAAWPCGCHRGTHQHTLQVGFLVLWWNARSFRHRRKHTHTRRRKYIRRSMHTHGIPSPHQKYPNPAVDMKSSGAHTTGMHDVLRCHVP